MCAYVYIHTYSKVTVRVTAKDPINQESMSWSDSKGNGEWILEGLGRQLVKLETIGFCFCSLALAFLSYQSSFCH